MDQDLRRVFNFFVLQRTKCAGFMLAKIAMHHRIPFSDLSRGGSTFFALLAQLALLVVKFRGCFFVKYLNEELVGLGELGEQKSTNFKLTFKPK